MRKHSSLSIVLSVFAGASLLAVSCAASPATLAMEEGKEFYLAGEYDAAVEKYTEALGYAEEDESLDAAAARLNLGTTLAATGDLEGAATELQEALKTEDLNVQAKTQYNLGHVRYQQATTAVDQQDLQTANGQIQQSLDHFRNSLRLEPSDVTTKRNFELSQLKKKEIELLLEQQPPQEQPEQDPNGDEEDEENEDEQDQDQENQDSDESEDSQDQEDQESQDQQDSSDPSQENEPSEGDEPSDPPEEPEESPENSPSEGEENQEEESEPQPAPENPEQMTPEEAKMLLEAMRDEEQNQREKYQIRLGRPQPVDKDW